MTFRRSRLPSTLPKRVLAGWTRHTSQDGENSDTEKGPRRVWEELANRTIHLVNRFNFVRFKRTAYLSKYSSSPKFVGYHSLLIFKDTWNYDLEHTYAVLLVKQMALLHRSGPLTSFPPLSIFLDSFVGGLLPPV